MPTNPHLGDPVVSPRTGIVGACLLALAIAAFDVAMPGLQFVGLLVAPPFLAAALASYRATFAVGALCFVLGAALGMVDGEAFAPQQVLRLAAILVFTALAAWLSMLGDRTSKRVATLSKLAAVAQQAVLRPIGPRIGTMSVAVRYVSANAEADIGGDLYEAMSTPYGTRVLIGDVRGKGLEAVRLASSVLGSYRHVAHERVDLRAIVADLDRAVARSVGYEDFVTACLIEERGGTLTVLNCGHPAPLLLRRGDVIALEPPSPAPPLGFLPVVRPRVERLEPGDRLLLFTDGLAEARRNGEFFPIRERAWRIAGHGTVEDGLTSLVNALRGWVHGVLDDDIALILLEYTGSERKPETSNAAARPAWEWDPISGD
ncbi:PP2C family protein-serine/threonine phosphatase [Cryptosporangium arvum]|jgi:serine phosphatase RsbU (regulator of sigma subunit)|uniref:PP2C family protein-serine/threonine phosphatase n=1 Tax=Cryptosporangium arvum TaxID=80871 RepID=UPI0004B2B7CE|nr:PP2C family protein-serine/threonine phosphatase [Cryptosporangium arvum]